LPSYRDSNTYGGKGTDEGRRIFAPGPGGYTSLDAARRSACATGPLPVVAVLWARWARRYIAWESWDGKDEDAG
jgi:hypothetical protein